jgi:hypothetical protein
MQLTSNPKASEVAQQTTSPITPGAEWIRPAGVQPFCGIGRSVLFKLIRDGEIKSVVLRRKGAKKGCRLISVASLRAYINGMEAK